MLTLNGAALFVNRAFTPSWLARRVNQSVCRAKRLVDRGTHFDIDFVHCL
jgi:hypothetical protein